jgi:hypothetical protein
MLIFLGPNQAPPPRLGPHDRLVHGVETLIEAAYSKLPEHAALKADVATVSRHAYALAQEFGQALPDSLQDFWAAYSGWFAMYSVGPLLANWRIGAEALTQTPEAAAHILENWRSRSWWSGRHQVEPALRDEFRARGVACAASPGAVLRWLQRPVMGWAAQAQARREVSAETKQWLLARSQVEPGQPVTPDGVLWLSVGGSSADLMARLIPPLQQTHGLPSQIVDFHYYQSAEACRQHGLPYRDITTFADVRDARELHPDDRHWGHFRRQAADLPCRAELPPALFGALLERMRLVLRRDSGLWRWRAAASRRALDACQPRCVVAFHVYGPPVMPLVVEARKRNLPCLSLQHGVIGPRYLALPCPRYSEKLVFGAYARDIMTQACPEGMTVTVTGNCLYDGATGEGAVQPRPEVMALREGARGLVLLCTQFNEHLYHDPDRWWMAEVARACRALGARLAIKVHPSDGDQNIARYRSLEQPGDDRVVVIPHGQYPLPELLAACDVMVTRDSTVVFEANLLDKPVVTINLSQWEEELPYAATGGALGVYRYDDIAPALERVLRDPGTREALAGTREAFLQAYTGPRDGQATERISQIIADWSKGSRRP